MLQKEKDKMWVRWVHSYYIKRNQIWQFIPKQASWVVQKIIKMKTYVQQVSVRESDLRNMTSFSIKKMYALMRGDFPKVQWKKLVCNNFGSPKWIFILRLAAHSRLVTRDRLMNWGIIGNQECPLCAAQPETIAHLFFKCDISAYIWNQLLK